MIDKMNSCCYTNTDTLIEIVLAVGLNDWRAGRSLPRQVGLRKVRQVGEGTAIPSGPKTRTVTLLLDLSLDVTAVIPQN